MIAATDVRATLGVGGTPVQPRETLPRRYPARGRPKIAWRNDEDRHAVAYLEMTLRTSKRGLFPSVRRAATLAACVKEGDLRMERNIPGAPPQQLAPSGRRNSPVQPSLKGGYRELELSHVSRRQGGVALENCALRLRRKHRTWSKNSWQPQCQFCPCRGFAFAAPENFTRSERGLPADCAAIMF